ncbi:unnamed protein product [Microthlaspi erraticum]|uniref:F-box domain-containing protein n=1 Tax=Microthlaspi erraticum TaxID=1685480 RepID=A0A6D2KTB0_9BRAS|nr:unnamed protein product [Microthlaspi erraticum]
MVTITALPDDLLLKILSFLPSKAAVSTSILSKQWEFLWMWVPKLEYDSGYDEEEEEPGIKEFIDKNLPLHRAPVIESLTLYFGKFSANHVKPEDLNLWVEIAVSRSVRELEIYYHLSNGGNIFPSSFYTCKSLVILELRGLIFMDVVPSMVSLPSLKTLILVFVNLMDVPSMVSLPSLKTLQLDNVRYQGKDSLQKLLSSCPVLEDLSVDCLCDQSLKEFTIIVPSLQSLSLLIYHVDGYMIDTPSLKYFKLVNYSGNIEIKNMPMLREAYLDVLFYNLKSVVKSITSVKRLTICSEDVVYDDGFVFKELEHLKICGCHKNSSILLTRLLHDSPNLRVLDISYFKVHGCNDMVPWNQPSHVPKCLLSSLQFFKWSQYFGRPQDRDIAVYILKNACRLKTVTILADTKKHGVSNLSMIKELTLSSRASSTCELVFVEWHHVVLDESSTEESSDDEIV